MKSQPYIQHTLFPVNIEKEVPEDINVIPFFLPKRYLSFLYKSFGNKECSYLNKKVTAIQIYQASSFGKYLSLLLQKSRVPVNIKQCNLFFSINEVGYKNGIYKRQSGKYSLLEVPPELSADLINYIHDYFILSLVSFVDGYKESGKEIMEGIICFMDQYELWDHWDKRSLHRIYYRDKSRGQASRFCFPHK